jgi:hypothetical protein
MIEMEYRHLSAWSFGGIAAVNATSPGIAAAEDACAFVSTLLAVLQPRLGTHNAAVGDRVVGTVR